jgi:hypothetical protein
MVAWWLVCETSYTIGGWYHGGINIHGLGVSHPKDPTGGLKGGSSDWSPLGELPPSESPSCPPSGGWGSKPLGIWVSKLIVTYPVVGTNEVIGCWASCLSLLVIGWTTIRN